MCIRDRCPDCGEWNSLESSVAPIKAATRVRGLSGGTASLLSEVQPAAEPRISTGLGELDRVLGGGLVAGSVTLLGGDPGIGKSTLLLQAAASLGDSRCVL